MTPLPRQSDVTDEPPPTESEIRGGCETILRAYGIDHPTQAERRAYVDVLGRMGAFAESERATLRAGGLL
jgi:hypothetical protein